MRKIIPPKNRVILKFPDKREETDGGLVIPDVAKDGSMRTQQPWICDVLSVGPGYWHEGAWRPGEIRPGQKVLISHRGGNGTLFMLDDASCVSMPEDQILAVIEEEG